MHHTLLTEPVAVFLTIMAVVLVTPMLSERIRLPGIVGLILGGILIGPHGLRLLDVSSSILLLATIGLIYLMFSAGLEVNLRQFNRVRKKSLIFGFLTYLLPQGVGMLFGRWLGMDWLGAVLLGSAFSSHTLIAFPILGRIGIINNEAVSITVGATIFTDIVAFVVLAAVNAIHGGTVKPGHFIWLFILLIACGFLILVGLPRLGKAFFRRFHSPAVEFQFVLVVLFVAAVLAEMIGVHAVVGAFLAGLAINATLPHRSTVIGRVLFLGESFFIPIFLVYSGMITDITVFLHGWETLLIGAGMTFIAYFTKLAAAWMAARIFHYSRNEFMTVWGLSQAQAAVTIPTLIIGLQLGLFPETVFNAAIVMVLLTSITSPIIVQRYGRLLAQPKPEQLERQGLFDRILIPIANPQTQEYLIELAAVLASTSNGILFPLNVAVEVQGRVEGLAHQRTLLESSIFEGLDSDVRPIRRVDSSPARGIARAAIENDVSLIVMGWRGRPAFRQSILGTLLDEVTWKSTVPVLVGRLTTPVNAVERIVLVVPQNCLIEALIETTIGSVIAIARAVNVPVWILCAEEYLETLAAAVRKPGMEHPCHIERIEGSLIQDIVNRIHAQDLVVFTTMGSSSRFRSSLGQIPEQLAAVSAGSLMVIHYPSSGESAET